MKTALITGASGGIGIKTAELFLKNGYFVIAQYNRNDEPVENLKKSLGKDLAGNIFPIKCNFADSSEVYSMTKVLGKHFPFIDVLVNNAGVDLIKLITRTTEKEWDEIFAVNIKAAFILTSFVLEGMIDKKRGKIVNVSSVWGKSGASCEAAYSASKAALIGFTKAVAKEVAPSNINVNCVCPGVIDTKMNECFTEEEKKDIISSTPLNRMGRPEEIAKLIYYLSSSDADFITGEVITADGGFIL